MKIYNPDAQTAQIDNDLDQATPERAFDLWLEGKITNDQYHDYLANILEYKPK